MVRSSLLDPDIVRKTEGHTVQVKLARQHTRGCTAVGWYGRTGQEPNVNLVLEVDPVKSKDNATGRLLLLPWVRKMAQRVIDNLALIGLGTGKRKDVLELGLDLGKQLPRIGLFTDSVTFYLGESASFP